MPQFAWDPFNVNTPLLQVERVALPGDALRPALWRCFSGRVFREGSCAGRAFASRRVAMTISSCVLFKTRSGQPVPARPRNAEPLRLPRVNKASTGK